MIDSLDDDEILLILDREIKDSSKSSGAASILLTSLQLHTNDKIENLHSYKKKGDSKTFSREVFSSLQYFDGCQSVGVCQSLCKKIV